MRKILCIMATICLTLIGLGSCSFLYEDEKAPYSILASLSCKYEDGTADEASKLIQPFRKSLEDKDIDRIVEGLCEEVREGFSSAAMTLDWYDNTGNWTKKETYRIDNNLTWEKSY